MAGQPSFPPIPVMHLLFESKHNSKASITEREIAVAYLFKINTN